MTDNNLNCDWCACVRCSEGNCCDHGEYLEGGKINWAAPHRVWVKPITGNLNAIGGEFVVEDQFGNLYTWTINCLEIPGYRGLPEILLNRISGVSPNDICDVAVPKAELKKAFGEML